MYPSTAFAGTPARGSPDLAVSVIPKILAHS